MNQIHSDLDNHYFDVSGYEHSRIRQTGEYAHLRNITTPPPTKHGCKGFCGMSQFKDKHDPRKKGRYTPYGKYCAKCEIHLQINIALINFCPCCGKHLRIKPRNRRR